MCSALNGTDTGSSLKSIVDILKTIDSCNANPLDSGGSHGVGSAHHTQHHRTIGDTGVGQDPVYHGLFNRMARQLLSIEVHAGGGDGAHEHTLLEELTHVFHLGSMVILSVLVLEVRNVNTDK